MGFLRALSAAATLLLLVASASLAAIASSLVIAGLRYVPVQSRMPPQGGFGTQVQQAALVEQAMTPDGRALAALGPETHAVDELWQRAEQRAAEGVDVTLVRASLPRATAAAWTSAPGYLRVLPARSGSGLPGLRIVDLGAESAPALAGVRRGDVITAVNGYALASPEDGLRAFAGAGEHRALVAEIERDGHRIALRVDWKA